MCLILHLHTALKNLGHRFQNVSLDGIWEYRALIGQNKTKTCRQDRFGGKSWKPHWWVRRRWRTLRVKLSPCGQSHPENCLRSLNGQGGWQRSITKRQVGEKSEERGIKAPTQQWRWERNSWGQVLNAVIARSSLYSAFTSWWHKPSIITNLWYAPNQFLPPRLSFLKIVLCDITVLTFLKHPLFLKFPY